MKTSVTAACLLFTSSSLAQEPPLPEEEDTIPLRQPPPEVDEPESEAKPAPQKKPARAPVKSKAEDRPRGQTTKSHRTDDDDDDDQETPRFGYFSIGPAMLNISGTEEYGFSLGGGGRFPFHEKMAFNAGVGWGLTSFHRTGEWWGEARDIARWTTNAYRSVSQWVSEGEDDQALRGLAAFYAYIGLLFPYAVSGIMYVLGPFAATSFLEFHMEATFHLQETRWGPYVGTGVGTAAIFFPNENEMKGAIGPTVNLGYDLGWFGVEARGFYSPAYLHGEPDIYRTDIFTGQFLFRFQGR